MLEISKETFEKEVLQSEGYVLVDYWSQGCEPCKALMPDIEELAEKYSDKVKFCKLDTTAARRLAIKEKVLGLPTIAIYKDGKKIDEVTKEEATKENVENMLKKYI
ncbi:thioredoxin 1 [Alkalithermobacter thermoalcaliphilus JW-YL-7 = DSM 7308]|uniref:Thioredoxin n=1 Tax=Alkalithermobacter thermoalcaliphilus JW-YL-7 = DSM 7308 TaxID=1121328 RepID=A0A150FNV3_CLOPD|nr:Thioredoxin domain-containing protein [[Clostridium] paradoxum JW-YL-7 = DSM 7308]SHK83925.1 thioredoxin 1 [[Clostridium] paradoxum JW-YL-7 = DSM 7308]